MLEILEHKSSSYAPRTYHNASVADVTIALAVDYSTAGEKLTHKAAGEKYLALPICDLDDIGAARLLWKWMNKNSCKSVNVAGNGIYTLSVHDISQEHINQYVYNILAQVGQHLAIEKIVSGGQTGVDLAGGVAGFKLGIPTVMTLPKGFKQRHEDKVDRDFSAEAIRLQVEHYASILEKF